MRLATDAVVLVFDGSILDVFEGLFRTLGRARQHESNRMKQAHPRAPERSVLRYAQYLTDVA